MRFTPLITLVSLTLASAALAQSAGTTGANPNYPEPSPYPITWELTFEYKAPKRIVVNVAGDATPRAYWYLPYTITNEGDDTQTFIPQFEMLTEDGKVHRARKDVPREVFDAIKGRERNPLIVPATRVGGELPPGVDEARDSVAVWEEPMKNIGTFKLFIGGLSGEFVEMTDPESGAAIKNSKGEQVILRKTLQLTYSVNGDEVYPGEDAIREGEGRIGRNAKMWVMR
jgi:hypothetical protein